MKCPLCDVPMFTDHVHSGTFDYDDSQGVVESVKCISCNIFVEVHFPE